MWDFNLGNYCITDIANVQFNSILFEKPVFTMSTVDDSTVPHSKKHNTFSFTCPGCGAPPTGREHNCKYCGRSI